MSFDVTTLALAKSYADQHGGSGGGNITYIPAKFVGLDDGSYTVETSVTFEQIEAAYKLGQEQILKLFMDDSVDDAYLLPLIYASTYGVCFGVIFSEKSFVVIVSSSNEWELHMDSLTESPTISAYDVEYSNDALPHIYNVENALDELISKSHTHSNKDILDKFGETDGQPTYNGEPIVVDSNAPIEIKSWSAVQQMVRLGIAAGMFSIGDQLVCNHETYGTLVWDIIGIDHDTPADSQYKHSLTIQLHDCLRATFEFDAAEPTNPDSNRNSYGSNNWLESGIRQWLNSDGNAGTWWEAKTEYDVKPSYASSTAGFLKGLDAEFLSTVGEVSKITARYTGTDGGDSDTSTEKFFLLSMTEVYGGLNNNIAEGVAYPYYADNSVLSSAGGGADANRIKYRNGAAQHWWLRSPYAWGSYRARYVSTTGDVRYGYARNSYGVAPACCII